LWRYVLLVLHFKKWKATHNAIGVTNEIQYNADKAIALAFSMITALNEVNRKYKQDMRIRIGIHMGEVNAGIVGSVKFLFGKKIDCII
jgi:class 3 adenylate cyclase